MRTLIAILSLTIAQLPSLAAQWPAQIVPGSRVRVRLPEKQYQLAGSRGHLLRGRVTALSPDTLYLAVTDSIGPLAIPRGLIDQLALSRGVPSRTQNAIKRGLLSGVSTALLFAGLSELDDSSGRWGTEDAALLGGAVGFATGAIFGALWPQERWKSLHLGTNSTRPGFELGLALQTSF
jgi:hypothetical protein